MGDEIKRQGTDQEEDGSEAFMAGFLPHGAPGRAPTSGRHPRETARSEKERRTVWLGDRAGGQGRSSLREEEQAAPRTLPALEEEEEIRLALLLAQGQTRLAGRRWF